MYTRDNDIKLSGFTDADWARSSVDRKSTIGYCFNIGSRMNSWCSRKQKFVVLSLAEAKYMEASIALCETIWLSKLLVNLFRRRMEVTNILCDNQSCIKLYENPFFVSGRNTLTLLNWGSVGCALAMKIGGEAKEHEIFKTHKWFG